MPPLPPPLLLPLTSPRKHRVKQRTALLALLALVFFTWYLLFIAHPSLSLSRSLLTHVRDHDHDRPHENVIPSAKQPIPPPRRVTHRLQPAPLPRPPLVFSPVEELAALSAFVAAVPHHNVLPPSVDPNTPLDPQLVLDFDPRSESAKAELGRLVDQTWSHMPVLLFTKLRSSDSRELRHLLDGMRLDPPPLVVEVDQREDAHVLLPILSRLTRVPGLPILLVGGQAIGTGASDTKAVMADIRKLHESGELAQRAFEAGATVKPRRIKGNNRRQRD